MSNKNVYMNEHLKKLDKITPKGQFGKVLGRIVHRFQLMMEVTQLPILSQVEKDLLIEALGGRELSPFLVRHLQEAVLDCKTGSEEERNDFSKTISNLSFAERIILYEAAGF